MPNLRISEIPQSVGEAGDLYVIARGNTNFSIPVESLNPPTLAAPVTILGGLGSGATPSAFANLLTLDADDFQGMSLLTPDDKSSEIYFGSPAKVQGGQITWQHTGAPVGKPQFTLGTVLAGAVFQFRSGANVVAVEIDENQNVIMGEAVAAAKVGIGTDTPDIKLTVDSGTVANNLALDSSVATLTSPGPTFLLRRQNPAQIDGAVIGQIAWQAFSDTSGGVVNWARIRGTITDATAITATASLLFQVNDLNAGVSTKMAIVGSDVGIGTETPISALHVVDTSPATISISDVESPTDFMEFSYVSAVQSKISAIVSTGPGNLDLSVDVQDGVSIGRVRCFRDQNTTEASAFSILAGDGTSVTHASISNKTGHSYLGIGGGKFGVGTLVPFGLIHVFSGDAGAVSPHADVDEMVVEAAANGGISILGPDASRMRLVFGSPAQSFGAEIEFLASIQLMQVGPVQTGGQVAIQSGAGVEAIRVDAAQEVGIGTTGPLRKLHVLNSVSPILRIESTIDSTTGCLLEMLHRSPTPGNGDTISLIQFLGLDSGNAVTTYGEIRAVANAVGAGIEDGSVDIFTMNLGVSTRALRVTQDQNIGVGTVTPQGHLHIFDGDSGAGAPNVNATEIVVEDNSTVGMTFLSPDANFGRVAWGTASAVLGAWIAWEYGVAGAVKELEIVTQTADGAILLKTGADVLAVTVDGDQVVDFVNAPTIAGAPFPSTPTGSVVAWATGSVPGGWLICDGTAVNRTTEAALFAILGIIYGNGDGTTTFNLPDYRGEFLRGTDSGAGSDPDAAGRTDRGDGTTGDAVGTKQADAFDSHDHGIGGAVAAASVGGTVNGASASDLVRSVLVGGNETRPRNVNVIWIIKT